MNDGTRRDLFIKECYVIEQKEPSKDEPVTFLEEHDEKCEWCGGNLVKLFHFNLSNPLLGFENLKGNKLSIATCPTCTCYGPIYTEINTNGTAKWSKYNIKPQYLDDVSEMENKIWEKSLRISRVKRGSYHAANQFIETTFSQIGGHPTWIQDAEYPKCPKCSMHMKFIGQIDWADIEEYGEGMYYAFICEECNIAATQYQQS